MIKFILLTTKRSGSNFIRQWINSHPNIRCHGELFLLRDKFNDDFRYYCDKNLLRRLALRFYKKSFIKYSDIMIERMIKDFLHNFYYDPSHAGPRIDSDKGEPYHQKRSPAAEKAVGFKLMYRQLLYFKELTDIFLKERVHIIHLIRENSLKTHLSALASEKRGLSHSIKPLPPIKVSVDTDRLLRYCFGISATQDKLRNIFSKNPYLEITYEDFFADNSLVPDKIADFLGVTKNKWHSPPLKKMNPENVKEIIENYDEVASALKGTAFEKFLN